MECKQCLEENKSSIAKKGYGYGYIGTQFNCERHNKQNNYVVNKQLKWSNNISYEKTQIPKFR